MQELLVNRRSTRSDEEKRVGGRKQARGKERTLGILFKGGKQEEDGSTSCGDFFLTDSTRVGSIRMYADLNAAMSISSETPSWQGLTMITDHSGDGPVLLHHFISHHLRSGAGESSVLVILSVAIEEVWENEEGDGGQVQGKVENDGDKRKERQTRGGRHRGFCTGLVARHRNHQAIRCSCKML